jgi:hypothetical protein
MPGRRAVRFLDPVGVPLPVTSAQGCDPNFGKIVEG